MAHADDNNTGDKAGHRARMRRRLLDGGAQALQDYELIESLLALGLPRIDTKPIAKALLREFGTIGAVLTATPDALMRVKGVGETAAAAIKIAQATALALLKERSAVQPGSRAGRRCSTICARTWRGSVSSAFVSCTSTAKTC